MCDLSTKETSDNYVQVVAQLSKRWRVIRCRHDLQWIIQRRSSADLNKGRWVGQSYHMTLESLRASCLGATGLQNDKIEALIDTGSGPEQLSPSIYSKVISASVGSGETKQVLLNVEDYGDLDVSSAVNFR